eukprot:m.169955 g.169955  ORF g.169955 m.169955 type:complete len:90 (+) comp13484_c6_seq1:75-344(+)
MNQLKTVVRSVARNTASTRRFASHGAEHKYTDSVTPIEPSKLYSGAGTMMGAVMWFWILWRAKHDLPHLLGFEHPWDHLPEEHGGEGHH